MYVYIDDHFQTKKVVNIKSAECLKQILIRMSTLQNVHQTQRVQRLQPFSYLFRTVALTICVFSVLFLSVVDGVFPYKYGQIRMVGGSECVTDVVKSYKAKLIP